MKKLHYLFLLVMGVAVFACKPEPTKEVKDDFKWTTESFADKKIIRYQVPGFDKLNLDQKKLVYYLVQAGLCGRDIIYDQNYRYNLPIRKALDKLVAGYAGDKSSKDWEELMLYAKQVWFSNGIHHHYSHDKFQPGFSREWFTEALATVDVSLPDEVLNAMFDPSIDPKRLEQNPDIDNVLASAVNYYGPDVTKAEAVAYYNSITDPNDPEPVEIGLNSRLEHDADGKLVENVWKADGLYGPAIQKMIGWLEKAASVAENEPQRKALELLIEYYKTGDLRKWNEYNIAWAKATEGDIDYINGFIEVYHDPLSRHGAYENIVQITDFEAS
ncbi:MAG: dihydrofolate reductase, partial [Bacteroidetes bacterium]